MPLITTKSSNNYDESLMILNYPLSMNDADIVVKHVRNYPQHMIDDSLIIGREHQEMEDGHFEKEKQVFRKRKSSDIVTKANTTNIATMSTPLDDDSSEP